MSVPPALICGVLETSPLGLYTGAAKPRRWITFAPPIVPSSAPSAPRPSGLRGVCFRAGCRGCQPWPCVSIVRRRAASHQGHHHSVYWPFFCIAPCSSPCVGLTCLISGRRSVRPTDAAKAICGRMGNLRRTRGGSTSRRRPRCPTAPSNRCLEAGHTICRFAVVLSAWALLGDTCRVPCFYS